MKNYIIIFIVSFCFNQEIFTEYLIVLEDTVDVLELRLNKIKELVKKYPNDMQLGENIRQFVLGGMNG